MLILDTNIFSEFMKEHPNEAVYAWLTRFSFNDLYTTTITVAEVRQGIAILPTGRKRQTLDQAANRLFGDRFAGRILSFDIPAAEAYADIVVDRRRSGRSFTIKDCMIAAVAKAAGIPVATRNLSDFTDCGIDVINPWAVA